MSDNVTVERVDLQKKDKSELQTIVVALGGKPASRATKADLIESVLELSGAVVGDDAPDGGEAEGAAAGSDSGSADTASSEDTERRAADTADDDSSRADEAPAQQKSDAKTDTAKSGRSRGGRRGRRNSEPPAEWETEIEEETKGRSGRGGADAKGDTGSKGSKGDKSNTDTDGGRSDKSASEKNDNGKSASDGGNDDADSSNRRRRRRGRGRDRDDEQLPDPEASEARGYLDLRDDGYGFLRVNGYLQSAEDVYVPVKMARLHGLRKGDLVEGTARPANRNEKNPALQTISSINGADPEQSKDRLRFEDLTPISPFERLRLETDDRPTASAARLADLVAPIGKGQRGLIVAPPEAGSLEVIKQLAAGLETNNPESHLMVLLFDGRPEDVVEVRRSLEFGEVAAASFDAAPEEQCALVDFTVERAKRMVEAGEDVVIIADGLTSIARAYSLGVQPTGRTITGVDAAALHPTKRFFGSARKLEEAGSLTILATIRVGTGALFDEAIFEEFQGTATSELHLDAWLADEGVFPNIDLELSTTRNADLLVEPDDLAAVDNLRALMAAAIDDADGPAVDAARRLVERLENSPSNEAFLAEIATATSL